MRGSEALERCLKLPVKTVLDIGSGDGHHANLFRQHGFDVSTLDFANADICGDFMEASIPKVDLIWCCHVLEHQLNVHDFLVKCANHAKYLAITVPPAKHNIVGGHLTLWNPGLLLYNMIMAGIDCSQAMVKQYGYNISAITEVVKRPEVDLKFDYGDIETLSEYFPFKAENGFNGDFERVNW